MLMNHLHEVCKSRCGCNGLSTVAVSITFNVLTPVSNLKESLFGTENVAFNLPWKSVSN